ncbi:TPA: hypothetical protein N0F65_000242 [Lagenidium giganteum]|uniref:ZSWIM1/3 RNaseH-like domain-containing protein n=1 Tax=Lagenidium giganteum TaxID=4803 RepID=A0AAV2YGG1_9STRA|nr:TPA: hypothetical protein N0F65_000242 [Lagenidium giganteum]
MKPHKFATWAAFFRDFDQYCSKTFQAFNSDQNINTSYRKKTTTTIQIQFVQHSVVDQETRENLELCVDAFKKNNPSWENVRAVVIGVLARAFPNAHCLLCQFHVLQHCVLSRALNQSLVTVLENANPASPCSFYAIQADCQQDG